MNKKEVIFENIRLSKLVHGGQCLAETPEGKKIFVWGGLPGELVNVAVAKKKKSYLEGVVTKVIEHSPDRIPAKEPESYLSTSPWQIMTLVSEDIAKQAILEESYVREKLIDIKFEKFISSEQEYGYRNKQEFGFWGDESGLHLAHYVRGTHHKTVVEGSALAMEPINISARDLRKELNRLNVWGGKFKTLVLRCSQAGEVAGALFVKERLTMGSFNLPESLKGLDIYYSDPKSPASIPSKKLYSFGDINLSDEVMGINIIYDVLSFFQVNLPVFEVALSQIKKLIVSKKIVDMYSGVGTIGVAVGASILVESDKLNINHAEKNVGKTNTEVVHAASEKALEYITQDSTLIVDPPRAGLHKSVIERIAEVRPTQVIYLSCNPSTQARDVALLQESYKITHAQGYNFFPRTPHIESLVVLELK